MPTKQDLLDALAADPDICDLGYDYAKFDRRGYCLWVIDCARHLLPIAERYYPSQQVAKLSSAIDTAVGFVAGKCDETAVDAAAAVPSALSNEYCERHSEIPSDLFETLIAMANAIKITLPDSKVYHEDVVYSAAQAANDGGEESEQEVAWQLEALKARVLES